MYLRQAVAKPNSQPSDKTIEAAPQGPADQSPVRVGGHRGFSPPGATSSRQALSPNAAVQQVEAWLRLQQTRRQISGEAGQIAAVSEWGGGQFDYRYDAHGDLVEIREGNGSWTAYTYDAERRLTRVNRSDGDCATYHYDAEDRLASIDQQGTLKRFFYDAEGRVTKIETGQSGAAVYRYDEAGRVTLARTSQVTTTWAYDAHGRVGRIKQAIGGATLSLGLIYDAAGRLAEMTLPGSDIPVRYTWDERGRPQSVGLGLALGEEVLAQFSYQDEARLTVQQLGNGLTVETRANPTDFRPADLRVYRAGDEVFRQTLRYNPVGEIIDDGQRAYDYDTLGRLSAATDAATGQQWRFEYDAMDNRRTADTADGQTQYRYDDANRLTTIENDGTIETDGGETVHLRYDRWGRLVSRATPTETWSYRYDDAGQLHQVHRGAEIVARLLYDHKGRLVLARFRDRAERYLYGPADELLAVTDENGQPRRLLIRTPLGLLAEVHGPLDTGDRFYRHNDGGETSHRVTDSSGEVAARFRLSPFGCPLELSASNEHLPCFGGHFWQPELGLFYCGARWYDPALGRFLTPDTFTGGPDDERLIHPFAPASRQVSARQQILSEWLKQPRVRNRYVFCRNDPVGHVDPNGHWSFGGVLLTLLGAIWTLPNTLFGLLVEITCLVGEVIRWLVWLVSIGNVSWETPGFDAAASSHLNAFALVFSGGWLGSFPSLLGITFGNVFFVYGDWENSPHIQAMPDPTHPPAYGGEVAIPRNDVLYEHELRHTNQYGWFGPFFHLGLPIFGVYLWDVIINGYQDAWLERDAREHSESEE